jgi:hypothetical protein
MAFTLAVCSFSLHELVKLQKSAIRSTLARLGINRNISRDIVFDSPNFGGLGLRHLFVEQGIAQLELLLRHLRAKTTQGALLLVGLSWWHLLAGFSNSLWEDTKANVSYVEHSWYNSLKDFLAFVNGTVHIPSDKFLPWTLLRQEDEYIMERISALPGASRADLKAFNRCRLYLGVFSLSEISSGNGLTLDRTAWNGSRARFSPFLWPFQPKPGPRSWRVWRRLLAQEFLCDTPKHTTPSTKDLSLLHPLGAWLPGSDWLCRRWAFHYLRSTGQLYQATGTRYSVHTCSRRSRRRSSVFPRHSDSFSTTLPPDAVPVDELSTSPISMTFTDLKIGRTKPATMQPPYPRLMHTF